MDEEFFSDDATLDALGDEELRALEEAAVASTQQAQQSQHHPEYHGQQQPRPLPNFARYTIRQGQPSQLRQPVYPPLRQTQSRQFQNQEYGAQSIQSPRCAEPAQLSSIPRNLQAPKRGRQGNIGVPTKPSSDYGDFDDVADELWDTAAPTTVAPGMQEEVQEFPVLNGGALQYYQEDNLVEHQQDGKYQQQQYYEDYGDVQPQVVVGNEDMIGVEGNDVQQQEGYYKEETPAHQGQVVQQEPNNVEELRSMVAQLQCERETLLKSLQTAESTVMAKAGEITIVRNNISKSVSEHQRIVASLNAQQFEEREKHRREVEAMKTDAERMKTEAMFLKKEVQDAIKVSKNLERNKRINHTREKSTSARTNENMAAAGTAGSPVTTPKKSHKSFAYRDGFDDDEIAFVSPTKPGRLSRPSTPKNSGGTKRKRPVMESPMVVLPLSQSRRTPSMKVEEEDSFLHFVDEFLLEKVWKEDDRFDFFKAAMAHKPAEHRDRCLETMAKVSFPSSPDTTLSGYFLDKVTLLRHTAAKSEFPAAVCGVLLDIWERCLQEAFYGALYAVLDLLRFGIMWDQGNTCHKILDEAVNLVQRTVDINAIPMLRNQPKKLNKDIDVGLCLSILENIALGVMGEERHTRRFWKMIRSDFPLMMLHINQPLPHIRQIISILCTSILTDSFGPLVSNELDQRANEGNLLEAATAVLVNTPKPSTTTTTTSIDQNGHRKYSRLKMVEMRTQVLEFFNCLAAVEVGLAAMARHRNLLPRLVKRIAEELDEVYEWRFGADKSIQFLNTSVRLLHGIITTHPVDAGAKLVGGANHKHIVAMTRLASSEGSVQEAGIAADVVECALGLVESIITPGEAEGLLGLFNR